MGGGKGGGVMGLGDGDGVYDELGLDTLVLAVVVS